MGRNIEIRAGLHGWPLALLLSAQVGCGRATDRTTLAGDEEPGVVAPDVMIPDLTAPDVSSGGAEPSVAQPSELPESPLEAQLSAIVERECRACHDGSVNDVAGSLSLGDLIDTGAISVGSGEASRLVVRLQFGDSSPAHRGVSVSDAELKELIRAINEREHDWPEACGPALPVGRDEIYATLLRDINTRPLEQRRFTRYVGLTYATNAGLCGSRLNQHREAILEMLNAVSMAPNVVMPRWVDELSPQIYAIDLRDYAYDRPIDLEDDGEPDFEDAWLAMVAEMGPYAQEFVGAEADELSRQAQTAVPFVSANALIQVAAAGDLYYTLVGVRNNLDDTAAALGVELGVDVRGLYRAGTFGTADSPDRLVTRRPQTIHPGRAYWTLDEGDASGVGAGPGLREAPIAFPSQGSQVMFHLPNGMLAFALTDSTGVRAHELPKCLGCDLPRALVPVTCRGCHTTYLFEPRDEVLDFARANPERYDDETLELITAQYKPAAELAGVVEADSFLNYSAKQALGAFESHIAAIFYEFRSHPLTPESAAAELAVSVAELREALGRLEAAPGTLDAGVISSLGGLMLDDGRVERDVFTAGFESLACSVRFGRNRPAKCP